MSEVLSRRPVRCSAGHGGRAAEAHPRELIPGPDAGRKWLARGPATLPTPDTISLILAYLDDGYTLAATARLQASRRTG